MNTLKSSETNKMPVSSAKFITIEGVDGAGKTTHLKFVSELLAAHKIPCIVTREPGGTELGEKLRDLLLCAKELSISDNTELLLMFAARMQHIEMVIKPALASGKWVLCDRFTDATFAYQGGGRQIPWQRIQQLQQWVQADFAPDKTFILDVSIDTGKQRTQIRGEQSDRFESQNNAFKKRVRAAYQQLAQEEPERIDIIDSEASIERIQKELADRIVPLLEA